MKYLCLIYGGATAGDAERLRPAVEATTVRVRDGRTQVSKGPFAETPDELAAFMVLECESMSDALARARELRAPVVEVRPEYVEEAP